MKYFQAVLTKKPQNHHDRAHRRRISARPRFTPSRQGYKSIFLYARGFNLLRESLYFTSYLAASNVKTVTW